VQRLGLQKYWVQRMQRVCFGTTSRPQQPPQYQQPQMR